jgi:hypothetical protein
MSMNTAIEEVIIKEVNAALEDTVVDTAADTE